MALFKGPLTDGVKYTVAPSYHMQRPLDSRGRPYITLGFNIEWLMLCLGYSRDIEVRNRQFNDCECMYKHAPIYRMLKKEN